MNLYFSEKYGKLYEAHEQAETTIFNFENQHGQVTNMFMKKEIPCRINNRIYYDISTPYGYGGPIITHASDESRLIKDYQKAFSYYSAKERIISEVIRYHPIENDNVRKLMDAELNHAGAQVIRNLKEPLNENMSKRVLKTYRRNVRKEMTTIIDTTGDYLDDFLQLYYSTMNRNGADDYYYFDRSFFKKLHRELSGNFMYTHILMDGKMIASGLVLKDDTYAYAYLGATREEYYGLSPNVNCEIDGIKWLKDNGVSYYIMGRGHAENDGIYQFKKRFARNSDYQCYIGKVIHNTDIYNKLVQMKFKMPNEKINTLFFPVYRSDSPVQEKVMRIDSRS